MSPFDQTVWKNLDISVTIFHQFFSNTPGLSATALSAIDHNKGFNGFCLSEIRKLFVKSAVRKRNGSFNMRFVIDILGSSIDKTCLMSVKKGFGGREIEFTGFFFRKSNRFCRMEL